MRKIIIFAVIIILIFSIWYISNDFNKKEEYIQKKSLLNEEEKHANLDNVKKTMDSGPYGHYISFTTSNDQKTWDIEKTAIQEHASVPDAIILEHNIGNFRAGTIMAVFVDASVMISQDEKSSKGQEKIGMMYSEDKGKTWSEIQIINIEGSEGHVPVDPSIVQLDDGTLLLYYFDFNAMISKADYDQYKIYVAESQDGLAYNAIELAYSQSEALTDPDIIYYNNKWLLYFVDHQYESISVAFGETAYSFSEPQNTDIRGIPGTMIVDDMLYLYGCGLADGLEGITSSRSSDGVKFSDTVVIENIIGCDPSPLHLEDGSFAMIFKGFMEIE